MRERQASTDEQRDPNYCFTHRRVEPHEPPPPQYPNEQQR